MSFEYIDAIAHRIKENIKGKVMFQVTESIEVRCKTTERESVVAELLKNGMNAETRQPNQPGKMDLTKVIITGTRVVESEKV